MQLNVQDLAQAMQVTERTVRRWIKNQGLPIHSVSGQDYIHRLSFFEWALTHRIAGATAVLGERRPVILPVRVPRVTICHFEPFVKLVSGRAETMKTLFVIAAPTVRDHQLLLGHLTLFLWDKAFRSLIVNLASVEEIARFVRRWRHTGSAFCND